MPAVEVAVPASVDAVARGAGAVLERECTSLYAMLLALGDEATPAEDGGSTSQRDGSFDAAMRVVGRKRSRVEAVSVGALRALHAGGAAPGCSTLVPVPPSGSRSTAPARADHGDASNNALFQGGYVRIRRHMKRQALLPRATRHLAPLDADAFETFKTPPTTPRMGSLYRRRMQPPVSPLVRLPS